MKIKKANDIKGENKSTIAKVFFSILFFAQNRRINGFSYRQSKAINAEKYGFSEPFRLVNEST
jgi:hypothetical protein